MNVRVVGRPFARGNAQRHFFIVMNQCQYRHELLAADMNLGAVDRHMIRGGNADPNPIALYRNHGHPYVPVNDDLFTRPTR